jgi:hypothetical protein
MTSAPDDNATPWRKSTYSSESFNCVEVSISPGRVLVRDSKNPDGAILVCATQSWRDLVSHIRAGGFDLPAVP